MAVIGSLLVNVKANAAGFTSGLNQMRNQLVQFRSDITQGFAGGAFNGAAQSIGKAFGALGSGLEKIPYAGKVLGPLASGFGQLWDSMAPHIQASADYYDSLGKLSDRLGVQAESLVGLSHAADLSGVSQEQLVGGLEKFLATLGNAQAGIGNAADKFRALGLDINKLSGMAPEQALGAVFDEINSLNSVAARASATMAIFGKSGQALAPLIAGGAAGIRTAAQDVNSLGMALTRVDMAKIEMANDSLTNLGGVMRGFFGRIAAEMAPFVSAAIDGVLDVIRHFGGLGEIARSLVSTFKWVSVTVVAAFDIMTTPIRIAIAWVDALKENFHEVGVMISEIWEKFKTFAKGVLDAMPGLGKFISPELKAMFSGEGLAKAFTPNALKLHDWFGEVEKKAAAMGAKVQADAEKRRGIFAEPETAGKGRKESEKLGAAIKGSVEAFRAIAAAERRQADVEQANRPVIDAVGKVEKAVQVVADRLAKVIGLQEDIAVVEL